MRRSEICECLIIFIGLCDILLWDRKYKEKYVISIGIQYILNILMGICLIWEFIYDYVFDIMYYFCILFNI